MRNPRHLALSDLLDSPFDRGASVSQVVGGKVQEISSFPSAIE
jgi:hypothetical protein